MSKVKMPKLSDTMEEGTVLEWKKAAGDQGKRGDVLADIESDKASFDLEAEEEGLLEIGVQPGEAVPVGQVIATIGGEAGGKVAPTAVAEKPLPRSPAESGAQRREGGEEAPEPAAEVEAGAAGRMNPAPAAEAKPRVRAETD